MVERVHVLQLGARAETGFATFADGDVRIRAQRSLLHLCVRDAELDDRLAEQLQEALRLLGAANVRLRDDLHERRAAAVEVDVRVRGADDAARRPADVDRLGRVLLEMRPDDADLCVAVGTGNEHRSVDAERLVVL